MLRGRRVVILFVAFFLSLFITSYTFAQYGAYEGGYSTTVMIDKAIGIPENTTKGGVKETSYVDNYSSSDYRFQPDQYISFRLKIKNTSNEMLYSLKVKDILPFYIEPVDNLNNYNSSEKAISFDAGDFAVNEEKVYYLKFKIASQDKLPSDKGIICLVNKAEVSNSVSYDEDSAQFCIEKEVKGVKEVPAAGPEMGLVWLALNGLGIGTGLWLKNKSFINKNK
jgi:hypothetical protein